MWSVTRAPSASTTTRDPSEMLVGVDRLDDDRGLEHLLQVPDATLEERLLVARRLVVGVLAQVAQLAGALDTQDDLRPPDRGQLLQLRLERREPGAVTMVGGGAGR